MRAMAGLFLALVATLAWGGEIYTWKDASGKIHYSDTPPPGADSKRMRGGAQTGGTTTSAPSKGVAEQDMEFRKRQQASEKSRAQAEQEKSSSDEARNNCEQAKRQLQALESGQRMSRVNEAGENIPMDDEARAKEIEQTRKSVQSWCK
jgi:hypothetical protein